MPGLLYEFSTPVTFLPLEDQHFAELVSARSGILEIVGIEEKFDILRENYREFEVTLATHSLDSLLRSHDYEGFQEIRRELARRIANLLSASRLYLDQMCHHFAGKRHPELTFDVNALRSEQYDKSLAFRALEALRDYTQHRGMPIHQVTLDNRWEGDSPDLQRLRFGIKFALNVDALMGDGFKKKAILREIEAAEPSFDLKSAIREYVACVGKIHETLRENVAVLEAQWIERVNRAFDLIQVLVGERKVHGVMLGERDLSEAPRYFLSKEPAKYIERLRDKSLTLNNLHRRYFNS